MPIISLKRYMNESKEDVIFRRTISVLMQGMVLHAVRGDRVDHERLNAAFEQIDAGLPDDADASELLKVAAVAIQKLAEHNDRTTRFIQLQSTELHNMIGMLAETVIGLGSWAENSSVHLKEIEQQIKQAGALDQVQQIKHRLGECLANLREESNRQKAEACAASTKMQESLSRAQEGIRPLAEGGEIDKVTGLPMQADAENAIADAIEHPNGRMYVAAFLADRIQAINLRFGFAVGDRLLAAVAQSVRSQLSGRDRLFRWRGPAVVGLLERRESIDLIRGQMARASVAPKEQMFDVGGRQVLIPVSAAWCLFSLNQPLETVLDRIEHFVAGTRAEASST